MNRPHHFYDYDNLEYEISKEFWIMLIWEKKQFRNV